jgi:hypothetical protein
MKITWLYAAVIGLMSVAVVSCDKERTNVNTPTDNGPVIGGKGGLATLKITAMDDTLAIDSCKIYIKYNAVQMPIQFDDSAMCSFVDLKPPVVTFPGLKKGTYYLYAKGWNIYESTTVHGGMPYTIVHDTMATFTLQIPVQPIK